MASERSVLVALASANRRGAEIQGSGLAAELERHGVRAGLLALRPASNEVSLDVDVIGGARVNPATVRALRRAARAFDVVIGYGSVTLPVCAAALAGTRTRFVYRSIGNPESWVRGRMHRARTGVMFRRADHVATLFDGAAHAVHSMYRVPTSRISVIPNARDPDEFVVVTDADRREARDALSLPHDQPVIAQIGSISAEKRLHLGISASMLVDGATLVVAGGGPGAEAARATAEPHGNRVRMLGPVTDVRPVLAAADVVLSTSSTEGMPGVLIEAALRGIPAVATDVGASRAVVGPGGLLVPAEATSDEIADALRGVIATRAEFGSKAHDHAAHHFTWPAVLPRWESLIASLSGSAC